MDPLLGIGRAITRRAVESAVNKLHKKGRETWEGGDPDEYVKNAETILFNRKGGTSGLNTSLDISTLENVFAIIHERKGTSKRVKLVDLRDYVDGYKKGEPFSKSKVKRAVKKRGLGTFNAAPPIALSKPDDPESGFRCYKYKCPHCNELSAHITNMTFFEVDGEKYREIFGAHSSPFWAYLHADQEEAAKRLKKLIGICKNVKFSGYMKGTKYKTRKEPGYYKESDVRYTCSNCFEESQISFDACDCRESVEGVVPASRKVIDNSGRYCVFCDSDLSFTGTSWF